MSEIIEMLAEQFSDNEQGLKALLINDIINGLDEKFPEENMSTIIEFKNYLLTFVK